MNRRQQINRVGDNLLRRLVPSHGEDDTIGKFGQRAAVNQWHEGRGVNNDQLVVLAQMIENIDNPLGEHQLGYEIDILRRR